MSICRGWSRQMAARTLEASQLSGCALGRFQRVVRCLATKVWVEEMEDPKTGYKGGLTRKRPNLVRPSKLKEKDALKKKEKKKESVMGPLNSPPSKPIPDIPTPREAYSFSAKDIAKLDEIKVSTGERFYKERVKLSRSLEKKTKSVIGERGRGTLEIIGDEIADIINESLSKNKFANTFKRVKDATPYVEIVKVVVNRDLSHADAYWISPIIHKFAYTCRESLGETKEQQLLEKMTKYINERLQNRESKFRTEVMRAMSFKKVPRIFFHKKKIKSENIPMSQKEFKNVFNNMDEESGFENHSNGGIEDYDYEDFDDYGPDHDLSTLSFSKKR